MNHPTLQNGSVPQNDIDIQRMGENIRNIRQRLGLSLSLVARKASMSKSSISKIENGQISPPVATLVRIAYALGVHLSEFFITQEKEPSYVLTRNNEAPVLSSEGSPFACTYLSLAANMHNKRAEPFILIKKASDPCERCFHGGQEFIFVLSGLLELILGEEKFHMHPGDSIYFDPRKIHMTRALGNEPAKFLCLFIEDNQK